MKRVSYKRVLLELSENFGDEVLDNELWLLRHIRKIEVYGIGGKYAFVRNAKKDTVENYKIAMPLDAIQVLKIFPGDHVDDAIKFYNTPKTSYAQYSPSDYNEDPDLHGYVWNSLYYTNNEEEVYFEVEGEDIKFYEEHEDREMTLQYWAFQKNQKGEIMVNESHIDALIYGLMIRWLERDVFQRYKSKKLLRGNDMGYQMNIEKKYHKAVRDARAIDNNENMKLQKDQMREYFSFPIINDRC
jgi:hypothetical protein